MKLLFFSIALVFAAVFSLPAQNIPLPTHIVENIAPDVLAALQPDVEYFNYYNGNGDLYEIKTNHWDGADWVLSQRVYFTLNASGQPIQILFRNWKMDSLKLFDHYRTTIGYQPNGLQNFYQGEQWYQNDGVWKTHYLWTTTYNNKDKVQEDTYQYFTGGVLSSGTRFNYQYDSLDRKSQEIKLQWINGTWENEYLTDYSYPGLDELKFEALTRIPDGGAPLGLLYKRSTQTGTALQTIKVDEYHNTGNWMAHLIATSNYSNDGQILSYVEDRWNVVNSNWNVEYKVESAYNPDKSIHQHILYQRSETLDTLYVWYILDYDYGNYPVSVHPAIGEARVSISPNPTSDFVQVALEGKEIYNITLTDLYGKVLARTSTTNTANISLAGHAAGVYLLHIEQNGAVKVLPVVKN